MGAIAAGGWCYLDESALAWPVSKAEIEAVVARERAELLRRERRYRGQRPPLALEGQVLLLVDDGLATGATMRAAVMAVRAGRPESVVVAVPVASREAVQMLGTVADEVVCAFTPEHFRAVGLWYQDFGQTPDEEVCRLLADG